MSKEEKINLFIADITRVAMAIHKEELTLLDSNAFLKAMELFIKILSLPTRTIETLEVGDYVEIVTMDSTVEDYDYPKELKGVISYVKRNHIEVNTWEFEYDDIEYIKIIPHEAFELLKEVVGNESQ